MKSFYIIFQLSVMFFLSVGCKNTNSDRVENEFTEKDSTEVLNVILDSLNEEMYAQWFIFNHY
jgi:hypothetical protein